MKTTFIIICIIAFISGILLNELIHALHKSYGVLRIDHSDPTKDIYRIDINRIEDLSKKKIVILKVDNNADLSQK